MSKKNVDKQNRLRSEIIVFRVSPEEKERIDQLVKLSGMTKQDYIVHRLENEEMILKVTPTIYLQYKYRIELIIKELSRISNGNRLNPKLQEQIELIASILLRME